MSMIKWSHLNSENSSSNFAFLSQNSRHDCGCVKINDSGIYMISFIQFLGMNLKKKPCIQLQIDGTPVLSTISDKTGSHLIFHDDT